MSFLIIGKSLFCVFYETTAYCLPKELTYEAYTFLDQSLHFNALNFSKESFSVILIIHQKFNAFDFSWKQLSYNRFKASGSSDTTYNYLPIVMICLSSRFSPTLNTTRSTSSQSPLFIVFNIEDIIGTNGLLLLLILSNRIYMHRMMFQ